MHLRKDKKTAHENIVFAIWFSAIFLLSFSALYVFGLVPGVLDETGGNTFFNNIKTQFLENISSTRDDFAFEPVSETPAYLQKAAAEVPVYIRIPKAGVDTAVSNPDSTDIAVLDQYLTRGAVRYPGSGKIGEGNMLLFGHSSNWKVVKNPAYKAFNNIWELKAGDEIYIKSATGTYLYKVRGVKLVDASEELVDFSAKGNILTLSTCDTFGKKQDRYVVEADYVGKL